jgi:hypothetical protein
LKEFIPEGGKLNRTEDWLSVTVVFILAIDDSETFFTLNAYNLQLAGSAPK